MLSIESVLGVIHDVPPLPPLTIKEETTEFLEMARKLLNVRRKADRAEQALLGSGETRQCVHTAQHSN